MDGECGHTRNINLRAKPRTKKPTHCTVQRALSSATGKSHGRGSETSSTLAGQTPAPPVAPGHPVRVPFTVKSLWLPPLERWAGPLRPLGSHVDKEAGSQGRDRTGTVGAVTTLLFN